MGQACAHEPPPPPRPLVPRHGPHLTSTRRGPRPPGPAVCGICAVSVCQDMRGSARGALEGKGLQSWPQRRLDVRLEEVAEAVGGGHCRLPMPLKVALAGTRDGGGLFEF